MSPAQTPETADSDSQELYQRLVLLQAAVLSVQGCLQRREMLCSREPAVGHCSALLLCPTICWHSSRSAQPSANPRLLQRITWDDVIAGIMLQCLALEASAAWAALPCILTWVRWCCFSLILGQHSLFLWKKNEERKSHVNTPTAVNMLRFGSKNTPPPPTSPNLPGS